MGLTNHLKLTLALVLLSILLTGCSYQEARVHPQHLSPSQAAAEAMAEYDSDGDGFIDSRELEASPPLRSALSRMDTDGDGRLSEAEIAARLENWVESKVALFPVGCQVFLNGRPLADATVRLEPEPFLGDDFKVVVGHTTDMGGVQLETLPGMPIPGFPPGLYRVRISKTVNGKEIIPAKYNEETILGQEVATDAQGMERTLQFRLNSG